MISKKLHTCLFFLLLVISTLSSKAQNFELINASLQLLNSANNSCSCDCIANLNTNVPFYEGKITLKDRTVLTGEISVNQQFQNTLITLFKSDDQYEAIANATIKDVSIFNSDTILTDVTKFVNINDDDRLYRLVYDNADETRVYDSSSKLTDTDLVGRIFIIKHNTLIDTWNFWSSGPKKDLINYLNDRDDTTYKRRDFESLTDLFAKL